MELEVLESPGKEWDEFASRYTDLIFYQSLWSQVLEKGLGGQPLYFCLREGGDIVSGLPAILLHFKIFKILYGSIPYGNLVGEHSYFLPFMELLEREFQRLGIDQVRIVESPFLKPYQPGSFQSIPGKCTLLDLRKFDKEKIWQGYRNEVRRALRKAQKNGLVVKRMSSQEEANAFYQLYVSSMERNRAPAKYPLQWFHALYGILVRQRRADILFAMKDDQYAAGVVLIYSSTSIHYLHNGSRLTYLENRPNDLIVDYIIQEGVKEGKTVLDFMGSDPGDLSLIRFKEKWGSHSFDIYTYLKDYHPIRCKIWEWAKRLSSSRTGSRLINAIRK